MKSLNIITITDGNLIFLKKTLKSIDEQNYKNYKNMLSQKKINYLDNKFKKKREFFTRKIALSTKL